MARLFFDVPNCNGATSALTGRNYNADKQGFIHVNDAADVKYLKEGGYIEAGGMPRLSKYWVCDCGWSASINSCPKCERNDLTKVEK